mmetsp:Transcript_25592/g.59598  ORF Transcript_25592/g.59598 Transcript_25592/m.59598 type:complete len:184 (+) Transcript_25592:79-630(+)
MVSPPAAAFALSQRPASDTTVRVDGLLITGRTVRGTGLESLSQGSRGGAAPDAPVLRRPRSRLLLDCSADGDAASDQRSSHKARSLPFCDAPPPPPPPPLHTPRRSFRGSGAVDGRGVWTPAYASQMLDDVASREVSMESKGELAEVSAAPGKSRASGPESCVPGERRSTSRRSAEQRKRCAC